MVGIAGFDHMVQAKSSHSGLREVAIERESLQKSVAKMVDTEVGIEQIHTSPGRLDKDGQTLRLSARRQFSNGCIGCRWAVYSVKRNKLTG